MTRAMGPLTLIFTTACLPHTYALNILAPRPECTSDPECPVQLACIQEKCQDPCLSTHCGVNAQCRATNHRALCVCREGYVGDPYTICEERKS